ncbi:hypothetical protein AJ87_38250 [Rhizobium yanglingense]|nr:hypothetical protein AJ87_38250 [Rhizobium yanglingense]
MAVDASKDGRSRRKRGVMRPLAASLAAMTSLTVVSCLSSVRMTGPKAPHRMHNRAAQEVGSWPTARETCAPKQAYILR